MKPNDLNFISYLLGFGSVTLHPREGFIHSIHWITTDSRFGKFDAKHNFMIQDKYGWMAMEEIVGCSRDNRLSISFKRVPV